MKGIPLETSKKPAPSEEGRSNADGQTAGNADGSFSSFKASLLGYLKDHIPFSNLGPEIRELEESGKAVFQALCSIDSSDKPSIRESVYSDIEAMAKQAAFNKNIFRASRLFQRFLAYLSILTPIIIFVVIYGPLFPIRERLTLDYLLYLMTATFMMIAFIGLMELLVEGTKLISAGRIKIDFVLLAGTGLLGFLDVILIRQLPGVPEQSAFGNILLIAVPALTGSILLFGGALTLMWLMIFVNSLSGNYFRSKHPLSFANAYLVRTISKIENSESWNTLKFKRSIAQDIENISRCLETWVPMALDTNHTYTDNWLRDEFRQIAASLRNLKRIVLISNSDSRDKVLAELGGYLVGLSSGAWQDLPKCDPGPPLTFATLPLRLFRLVRALVLAIIPLAALWGLQSSSLALEQSQAGVIKIAALAWAVMSLLSQFDPEYEDKMSQARGWTKLLSK